MTGTSLVYILQPIVIPICLIAFLMLPYIADHYSNRRPASGAHPASPPPGRRDTVLEDRQTGAEDDGATQLRERDMDRSGG
jgi:hypothetical protein